MDIDNLSFADLIPKVANGDLSSLSFADLLPQRRVNPAAANPEATMPFGLPSVKGEIGGDLAFNPAAAIIKAGSWLSDLGAGAQQAQLAPGEWLRKQLGMQPSGMAQALDKSQEFAKQPMADLESVHPGSTQIGQMAAMTALPWKSLPLAGATEYGSVPERLMRGSSALLGNALAMKLGGVAAQEAQAGAAKAQANAAANQATAPFRDAGLVAPPAQANPTLTNRFLEGISGGTKTEQAAAASNAPRFNALAQDALDLPGQSLSVKALEGIRANEGKAYEAVKSAGPYIADPQFAAERSALASPLNAEVPELANPGVDNLIKALDKPQFSGATAVELVKKLRYDAGVNFRNRADPDKLALARAQNQAASSLEDLVGRNLAANQQGDLLSNFQAARERIAKTWTIQNALNDTTGNIAAREVDGKVLTGPLKTIQQFAERYPKSSQVIDSATKANPFSVVDAMMTSGPALYTAATHGALPGAAVAAAGVAGRPLLRSLLLSQPYQRLMTLPSERVEGLLGSKLLNSPQAPWLMGLLGYNAANR